MVLVVDKNQGVLDFYSDFYKSLCIKPVVFTDAKEAFDFFIHFHKSFSLITTGLMSAHKHDGRWLAQNIKMTSSQLPVILITGELLPPGYEDKLFSAVLIKPINLKDLTLLISFWHAYYLKT